MTAIRPLTGLTFETLAAAFNDAFSDYGVALSYTADLLASVQRRRGFRPDLSVGAFDGDRLVGFVFNCLDGDQAYNSGTGVAISHRREGIARTLMERSIELLSARRYVLEVLENNERAIELYRGLGFVEQRRFDCWTYAPQREARITELANVDLAGIYGWGDVAPSWQNSAASVARAAEPHAFLGNADGAAILFTATGDVPLLAVRSAARRRGLGTRLLDACATRANRPLRLMNIDDRDHGIRAFLEHAGATRIVRQIEMALELGG